MAKRMNASLASNKSVNTKWLQNALRSIGVSTKNVLKNDFAPNIYEAVESGVNTSRSVVSSLRRSTTNGNNVTAQLRNNKYVKFAQTAYKNALYDLKSGNLNNEDRFADSLFGDSGDSGFGDDLDSLFDDSGFSFGDDGADVNVNLINASSGNNDAMFAISTQLQKQTEAQLRTSQANMDAMIAINSASMMQVQQIGNQLVSGLTAINQNLSSLIEYNNSNMTKFIESSLAFYERMGSKMDSSDSSFNNGNDKITANQLFNSSTGGINFSQYKQYITQQMKGAMGNSSAGMVASLLDDEMIKMAVSNPLGFATEGLVKFMVPKMLANTIKGVESTFSSFMPALLHKLSNWGDEYATTALGKAKQMIGKTFGLRMERVSGIDKGASIEKGPVPFDGITKHAITEIITKELREQTSYLKKIAEHYGIDTKDAKMNSDVFDYKSGKYIKEKDVTANILNEIKDATLATMKSGAFGQEMKKASAGGRNDRERDAISAMVDELLLRFEKNGKYVSMTEADFKNKDSDYSKILNSVSGDKALKKYLDNYMQDLVKRNPDAAMDLSRSVISANASRNNAIKSIEQNPFEYNLYAAQGLDEADLDELILRQVQNQNSYGSSRRGGKRSGRYKGKRISDKQINSMISNAHLLDDDTDIYGTGQINREGNRTLSAMISSAGSGMQNMMRGILSGNSDEAFNAIGSMVIDQTKIAFTAFKDNFLTPLKDTFFGTKDSDGFSRDGIFSGISNSFKDMVGVMKWHITGKSFKDSKGKMHEDKQDGDSVIGNLKGIATQVKNGVLEKLFGKEELDADGNPTGKSSKGLLGGFRESIKNGLIGWQEALFGKKLDEKEKENLKDSMVKNLNERLPSSMTGSVIGAGVGMVSGGSLLGLLVGGPIGGAAMGAAIGFASKSEKFQNYLFGEKDENGERTGGFVSKGVQDFFKKNKNFIIGGTALGALKGAITGGGLLGTLVGGPIAGAMMGMASSVVLKSKTFNEFLFGDEKTGQKGIIDSFKSVLGRHKSGDKTDSTDGGKAVGMSILGAGVGALTAAMVGKMGILGAALTPMGPIGGALIGLGLSIKAQKNTFKEWLFGKKDENGNKTKEGILGQFRNMLTVSVLRPLKNSMKNFIDDAKYELRYHILSPIRLAVEPIGNAIADFADSVKERVTNIFNTVGEGIRNNLINPIVKKVDTIIISPVRKVVSGVTRTIWGTTKRIVTMPFRLLDAAVAFTQSKIASGLKALKKVTIDPVKKLFQTAIINPTKKVFSTLFKGLGFAANLLIKKPLDLIGGVTGYLGDKLNGVGTEDRIYKDRTGETDDSYNAQRKRLKEDAKVDRYNNRKNRAERKIRNQNEQAIARATNYQLIEDTEENRQLAIAAGAKINTRIAAVEGKKKGESTNGMNENDILGSKLSDLSEEGKQTNILLRILNVLKGKPSPADSDMKKSDSDKKDKTNESKKDEETATDSGEVDTEEELTGADKIAFDIAKSGGIFKYIKNKGKQTKQNIKDGYEGSYLQSKINSIKSIIGRFKGNHYADGTENAAPGPAIINEGGPEIVDMSGGEKVYSNKKPIAVTIVGMAKGIGSAFRNIFGRGKSSGNSSESDTDSGEVVRDAVHAATIEGGSAEAGLNLISSAHPNKGQNDEKQESYEDDNGTALLQIDAKNRLNAAIDKGYTAEERQKKLEEEEQKAKMDQLVANTGEQVREQKGFSNLWSSIFSKKGLITGLILAAIPLIIRILKRLNIGDLLGNLGGAAGSALGGAIESAQFVNENGGLGDSKSASDKIDENINRFASILGVPNGDGSLILNEDGKWDHMSEANVKGVAKVGQLGAKWLTKTVGNAIKGKAAAKALSGSADDVTTAILNTSAKSLGKHAISNFGKTNLKAGLSALKSLNGGGNSLDLVRTASSTAAETAGKTASELLSKVIKKITSFFDNVCSLVAKRFGKKVAPNVVSGLLDDVVKVVTNHFPMISERIAALFNINVGLAATGVGLLAKEGTFIVLGAINGLTGTARLFKVDNEYVDSTMTAISSALGAFNGSMIGSIMDVINELVTSVTGVDVYSELATFIYNFIAGEEKTKELREGREKFEQKYLDYQNEEFKKQYDTLVKSGLLNGNDVSFEDYTAGVKDGKYKADYDSFADYNDNMHQTLGSRIGKGIIGLRKGIKSGFSMAGDALFGKSTTYKEDSLGNRYYDNKNGTWQVYSKDGKDFGYISEDAVPTDTKEKKDKQRGLVNLVGDAFEGTKNFFTDHKESIFYAYDGSYYTADGKHYSADGSTELKPLTGEEVASLVASGELKEGEITVKSGLNKIPSTIFNNVNSAWKTFSKGAAEVGQNILEGASNLWDKTGEFASKARTGIGNFFTKDYQVAYYANDGSYYLENGEHYSASGEKLPDSINLVVLSGLIRQGVLRKGDIVVRDSGINIIRKKANDAIDEGWNKFISSAVKTAKNVRDDALSAWDSYSSFVVDKGIKFRNFMLDRTGTAWYDSEGGFYISNGATYDYYSATGEKLQTDISAEEIEGYLKAGNLTEGKATVPSGLSTTIESVSDAAASTLKTGLDNLSTFAKNVRDRAVSAWDSYSSFVVDKGTKFRNYMLDRTDTAWYDSEGGFYISNGVTYDYYSTSGEKLQTDISAEEFEGYLKAGNLTEGEATVPSGLSTTIKKTGDMIVENAKTSWNNIVTFTGKVSKKAAETSDRVTAYLDNKLTKAKEFLLGYTKKAWFDPDGGYYVANGKGFSYYNVHGDLITEDVDADDVTSLIRNGTLIEGEIHKDSVVKTEIDKAIKTVGKTFTSIIDRGSKVFSSIRNAGITAYETIEKEGLFGTAMKLFSKTSSKVWFDPNGNYYKLNGGKFDYYNANNDLIARGISATEVQRKLSVGLLTEGTIQKDSVAKSAINKIQKSVREAWKSAANTVSTGWSNFVKWLTSGDSSGNSSIGGFGVSNYGELSITSGVNDAYVVQSIENSNNATSSPISGGNGRRRRRFGGRGSIPYYAQTDPLWGGDAYGTDGATMADTGCGPTAMAMVASGFTGKDVSPEEMAALAQISGMRDDSGTNAAFIDMAAKAYGMNSLQTFSPTANNIYESAMNGPTVLLGQNTNGIANPFTDAGHYVVTDGVDSNGMINVKDPRGAGYNRKYSVNDLANTTGTMWGFGGFGRKIKKAKDKVLGKLNGGYGVDRTRWLNIVRAVKKAIAAQKPGYSQSRFISIVVGGVKKSVRTDCSGYVGACLRYYGVWPNGTNIWTGIMGRGSKTMVNTGFTPISWPGWNGLTEGDILVNPGSHTEIFAYNGKNGHYVYNCGSSSSVNSPVPTKSGKKSYSVVWKPGKPGSNAITANPSSNYSYTGKDNSTNTSLTTTTSNTSLNNTASNTSLNTSTSSSGSVSNGTVNNGDSIIDKIGSFIGEFGNRAFTGILTGNYDTDWSPFWSGVSQTSYDSSPTAIDSTMMDSSTTGSSTTGSSTIGVNSAPITLSGNSNAEKIWNYYRSRNLKPNTIAGIMANMYAESGLIPNNVSNTFEKRTGMTDASYTSAVDKGKYKNFVKDSVGYGLVQWTFWTLKRDLLNYAKQTRKSIGDLGMQLEFLQKELSEDYPSTWKKMVNAKSPEAASTVMLTEFERPKVINKTKRAGYARKFYNQFAGGSGSGRATIHPRIVKQNYITPRGGRGNTINDILSSYGTGNSSAYISANSAQKYINSADNVNVSTALNVIIGLLQAITGNTAITSDKLELLKNLTNGNSSVYIGGNTTNVVNSSGGTSGMNNSIITGGNGTKISRNQRIAERIASGR